MPATRKPADRLIKRKTFSNKLGDPSRATFWRWSKKDKNFPKPIPIDGGQDLYSDTETDEYVEHLIAQRQA